MHTFFTRLRTAAYAAAFFAATMPTSRSMVSLWRAIAELISSLESRQHTTTHTAALQKLRTLVAALDEAPWPSVSSQSCPEFAEPVLSPGIARAMEYVNAHASEAVSLSSVARASGLSVRQLTTEFRRGTGITVHEYLIRRRLIRAVRLLVMSDLKVAAVATSVGFRDPSALYRQFTERLRTTPKAIRTDRESAAAALRRLGAFAPDSQQSQPD